MLDALPSVTGAFLLLFIRIGAILVLLPPLSEEAIPARLRVMLALGMTAGLYGLLSARVPATIPGVSLILSEILIGLAIGLTVRLVIFAISMAGSFVSLQIGLSSALVSDPALGGQIPLISRFLGLLAVLVIFGLDIHHLWFEAILRSYELFPVGDMPPAKAFAATAVGAASEGMALAVSLAAPLLLYGVIFNVALGLAARLAPGIQVFFIAQPLNLLLGLGVLMATVGAMLGTFANSLEHWLLLTWR